MANAGDLRKGLFFSGRSDFGIRPKPNVVLKSGAKFVLCNGSFCRGEKCTFAHSPEEMQLWNAELQSDSYESYGPSPPHEQRPFLMDAADFPGIPPRQYNPRPTPPGAMPGYVPFPLQQQRSPHIPQGFGQTPGLINSLDDMPSPWPMDTQFSRAVSHSGSLGLDVSPSDTSVSKPAPQRKVSKFGTLSQPPHFIEPVPALQPWEPALQPWEPALQPREPAFQQWGPALQPSEPALQPREPALQPREPALQPREPALQPREPALQPREPTLQPREPSLQPREPSLQPREPALQPWDPAVHLTQSSSAIRPREFSERRKKSQVKRGTRLSEGILASDDPLYASLSAKNYQSKFSRLVQVEMLAHEGVLRERCNNCYIYTLLGSQCPFMKFGIKDKYKYRYHLYAYLDGVSSDNLAYINQASFSATLTISKDSREEYTADVYVSKHNKRLILAFKKTSKAPSQNCTVEVAFNLKESYFNDLLNSVRNLNPGLISRIVLSSVSFRGLHDTACNMKNFVSYCSAEQLNALEIMASRPSSSPPILLHGSFGTGKSRLLALSVHYFQSCQTKQHPVRVLACTQQRISADKFLEYYDKVWVEPKKGKVYVIREYALDQVDHCYRHLYFTSRDFENGKLYNCDNLLLITTCLTAPHLSFLPQGYFSHIFIDEGSLMREPEAVAPLFLADAQTKIVIAGDSNQVGPALLVLGDLPKKNGLNVSLLQRLEKQYSLCGGQQSIATLSTNYRCHPEILNLVGKLFYNSSIKWNDYETPPVTHRRFPYPLVFVCSSLDEDVISSSDCTEHEADVIVQKTLEVAKGCPSSWSKQPMSEFFVISPCEEQVSLLRSKFQSASLSPEVKSSINIQGKEFRAVFLSTTEVVHLNGSTRNPTRSLCDPYVFNTALTRAKSLVMSVGNPFLLLKMEKRMVHFYDGEQNARCWSMYLDLCLQHGTVEFDQNLMLNDQQMKDYLEKIRLSIRDQAGDKLELELMKSEVERLNQELHDKDRELATQHMQPSPEQVPRLIQNFEMMNPPEPGLQPYPFTGPFMMMAANPIGSNISPPGVGDVQMFSSPPFPYHGPQYSASPADWQFDATAVSSPSSIAVGLHPRAASDVLPVYPNSTHCVGEDGNGMDVRNVYPDRADLTLKLHPVEDHSSLDSCAQRQTPTEEVVFKKQHEPGTVIKGKERLYWKEALLGYGGFGVVHHVIECPSGNNYALKVISLLENELKHSQEQEVIALKKLEHENIVRYEDHWVGEASKDWWERDSKQSLENMKRCLFILTELCQKDTLKHWLKKNSGENSRNRKAMVSYFGQIIEGLFYIHKNGCIHRDLKPSNIYFSNFHKDCLKIGDFGLVVIDQSSSGATVSDASGDVERLMTTTSFRKCGTFPYISPEQLVGQRPLMDCKSDIYSLGIILFELHFPKDLAGVKKYTVFEHVRGGNFPDHFKTRLTQVHNAVKKMTSNIAKERPSADEVRTHILADLKNMNRKAKRSSVPLL